MLLVHFRRQICLLILSAIALPCTAIPITGLYTTGVDDGNNPLALHAIDTHYTLTNNFGDLSLDTAYMADPIPWAANVPFAQWIAPGTNGRGDFPDPAGNIYTYSISFDLTGFDLSTVLLNVAAQADNTGEIFLNGIDTTFNTRHHLESAASLLGNVNTISGGFQNGINTLSFLIHNLPLSSGATNPTGLRVVRLDGTGDLLPPNDGGNISTPSSLALFIGALAPLVWRKKDG